MAPNIPQLAAPIGKVLVVDDNPIIQRAVYFTLRDHGVKVLMCGDITDSLAMIRAEKPDVIVLDINFPPDAMVGGERDGFWALDWIHHVQGIKDIPVILISSEDAEKMRPRAIAAGAVTFLQKPLDREALVTLVKELIARKPAPAGVA
jgi:chemosensory pili system protein ChpA (sensor histidine kinase/response regulator)